MIQEANLHWRYVDTESNLVMPWYTLPALKWLKEQDTKSWNVFEYGAGYSTIWWRVNCVHLKSVESDKKWAEAMGAWYSNDKDEYIKIIDGQRHFDCIIVDGIEREKCVKYCLSSLKSGGFLIIDNYDSENYNIAETEELLKDWPRVIHAQANHSNWATGVFTKP